MARSKKERKMRDPWNWSKELRLLPGYLIVIIWIGFTATFLCWILGASLSTAKEIFSGKVFAFESGIHWENYASAWQAQNVAKFFGNSLLYAVTACIGTLLISAPGAYVLSRFEFFANKSLKSSLIIAMSVPGVMIIMPIFALTTRLGIKGRILLILLYNTFMNEFILSLFKYTSILICVLYTYTKLSHLKLKVSDLAAIPLFIALSAVLHFTTLHIKILVPTGILILSSAFLYLRFKRPIQETVMVNIIAFAISIAFFIFF